MPQEASTKRVGEPEFGAGHLRARVPAIQVPADTVILKNRSAVCSDPALFTRELVARGLAGGSVRCWEGVAVDSLRPTEQACEIGLTDGRVITASRALVTTGPWVLRGPMGDIAAKRGVRVKKIVAFHIGVEPPPGAPAIVFFDHGAFLMPLRDRARWLLSITSEEWDIEPAPDRLVVRPEDREQALSCLSRLAPAFIEHCTDGRVFCDAYSPDGVPFVAGERGRWALGSGGSGAGFRLAPAIAEEAVALLDMI